MSDLDDFDGYVNFSERGVLPKCPGIYFVTEDGQIVYVGQSVNVKRRFIQHHKAMDFAELDDPKVYWKSCEAEELQKTEQDYIDKFNPRLNTNRATGRTPRPRPFQAKPGNSLIIGYKSTNGEIYQPKLVHVLSVNESEIKMQGKNDIFTLRFPEWTEIKIRGKNNA